MPGAPATPPDCFQTKYTSSNPVSRRLVGGFFDALARAVGSTERVKRVLEVACGEGVSTKRLRGMLPPDAELRASDVDPVRVDAARARNPGVTIDVDSIYDLSCPDRCFDLVVALEVLEHLDDPARGLREVCRASRRWVFAVKTWLPERWSPPA